MQQSLVTANAWKREAERCQKLATRAELLDDDYKRARHLRKLALMYSWRARAD